MKKILNYVVTALYVAHAELVFAKSGSDPFAAGTEKINDFNAMLVASQIVRAMGWLAIMVGAIMLLFRKGKVEYAYCIFGAGIVFASAEMLADFFFA